MSKGICTQVTLSRFENNGQVPSLKILIQLCNRLELSISELFPKVSVENSKVIEEMNRAEFCLILSEYDEAGQIIDEISMDHIEDATVRMRYDYLKAFVMVFKNYPQNEMLIIFNRMLLADRTEETEIFRLLAYTGIGITYHQLNDFEKAESYFGRVLDKIYDAPTKQIEDVWRVLHILYQCSKFYAEINEFEISNALAKHALDICSDNHVTYYTARLAMQLAKNAISVSAPTDYIVELIHDAKAYSKLNRNKIALKELVELEEEILNNREDIK